MAIQFDNQPQKTKATQPNNKMTQKLISSGLAKNKKQANIYLGVIAVLFFIVSLIIWL